MALVPEVVKRLSGHGVEVLVESGAGEAAMIPDSLYERAGAKLGDGAKVVVLAARRQGRAADHG